jgi:hypothetical protein
VVQVGGILGLFCSLRRSSQNNKTEDVPDFLIARIKNTEYEELKVAGRTVYLTKYPENFPIPPERRLAMCLVDSKTLIMGSKRQVRSVLERDKKPELSAALQAALQQADTSRTAFAAIDFKDVNPARFLGLPASFQIPEGLESLALGAEAGSTFKAELTVLCKDAKTADELRKLAEAALVMAKNDRDLPKDLADALAAVTVSTSGARVTGKVQVKAGVAGKVFKR